MNIKKFRRAPSLKAGVMGAQSPETQPRRLALLDRELEKQKLASADDATFDDLTVTGAFTHTGASAGVYGVAAVARPSAFTQTYATAAKTHANPTAVALTDNSGGTANTTVQALPDPADAPATADALRDDLVANLIPALRNDFADLAAAVNALIADVANTKQVVNSVVDDLQSEGWLA